MRSLLVVEDVRYHRASQDFYYHFEIGAGEIVAVLGSSGAGKTTLAELIAGFEQPQTGDIRLDNKSLIGLPPAERRVAYVFQKNNLFAHLSVKQNLALAIRPSGKVSQAELIQIEETLDRVSMREYLEHYPEMLSIGQQQRIALARAVLRDVQLLILDEPFSALDPGLRLRLGGWIQETAPQFGMACLLITHQPDEAARIAPKALFIANGKQCFFGESEQVFTSTNPDIQAFMGQNNA